VNLSPINGMHAAMDLFDSSAATIASFAASPETVDLGEQAVNLITATTAYDINARVLETQQAVTRAAIDMLA
jgi:flagellar hook protein FlgE